MDNEIEIVIDELGIKGDGVARLPEGDRVFVAGALPEERARVILGQKRQEGITGRLVEVIERSPERAEPPCVHFGHCGGCALQHMNATRYGHFKVNRALAGLLQAGLKPDHVEGPFISAPGSRRRAVLSAKCGQGGAVEIGFNERASHRLVQIGSCAVLKNSLVALLPVLREFLTRIMREGESYDVAIAESGSLTDVLITVLGKDGRGCAKDMAAVLKEMAEAGGITRISWQSSRFKTIETVVRKSPYVVNWGGFAVTPPPGAFMQATDEGERALAEFAVSTVPKKSAVADLYAGCGTFAFALLAQGHRVDAFEGDAPALKALADAGAGNVKLKAVKRDLAREPLTFQELKIYDAVVVDPPRVGAQKQAIEIARSSVSTVVSISCNPDSFAHDGGILAQAGFKLKRLRIVDQFLWSPHVEVAGLFIRK